MLPREPRGQGRQRGQRRQRRQRRQGRQGENIIKTKMREIKFEVIKHHKDLKIYKIAFDNAMRIFELSKKFPTEENTPSPTKSAVLLVQFVLI